LCNEKISSADIASKPLVISVIPIDRHRRCLKQTRRFIEAAAALGDDE
jgi:hypothetical protein